MDCCAGACRRIVLGRLARHTPCRDHAGDVVALRAREQFRVTIHSSVRGPVSRDLVGGAASCSPSWRILLPLMAACRGFEPDLLVPASRRRWPIFCLTKRSRRFKSPAWRSAALRFPGHEDSRMKARSVQGDSGRRKALSSRNVARSATAAGRGRRSRSRRSGSISSTR